MPKQWAEQTQWLDLPGEADLWDEMEAQIGTKICYGFSAASLGAGLGTSGLRH